ncbi:MAG: PUA domain-containing protein [Conexivisphaerales archaeon]
MKVVYLSKREAKELSKRMLNEWGKFGVRSLEVEKRVEVDEDKSLLIGKNVVLQKGDVLAPFVGDETLCSLFPSVKIDMGAIKFITNGANVMRPGIKEFSVDFQKDDVVIVRDEKFGKPIAVCSALISSEEAKGADKGAVLKNISYVGDRFWQVYKEYSAAAK